MKISHNFCLWIIWLFGHFLTSEFPLSLFMVAGSVFAIKTILTSNQSGPVTYQGSLHVTSDNFSDTLLDQDSQNYKEKEDKYEAMVSWTLSYVMLNLNLCGLFDHISHCVQIKLQNRSIIVTLQINATYKKSHLKDAFVGTTILGFSSGSLVVSFKVAFDIRYIAL